MPNGEALVFSITLSHDVYTPAAIEQATRAFHEICEVETDAEGESTLVRLRRKAGSPTAVCDDFLNYALELSVQELLTCKE